MASTIDRREFLHLTAGALVACAVAGCESLQTVPVQSRGGVVRLVLRNHPQLAESGFLRIQPPDLRHHLIVLAQADGEYLVVSPICTHQGCTVDIARDRLACPCHGSQYDRTGRVIQGPAEKDLTRYPAEVTPNGELVIRLATA